MEFEIGFQHCLIFKVSKYWSCGAEIVKLAEVNGSEVLEDREKVKTGIVYVFIIDAQLLLWLCNKIRGLDLKACP